MVVSSDETVFSTVNYRGFPLQLTAAGFAIPRQCRGTIWYFTRVSQPYDMCEHQFSINIGFDSVRS